MANTNFATLSPLTKGSRSNLKNANMTIDSTTADLAGMNATMGITSGKYYWEVYINDSGSGYWYVGLNGGYEGGGDYATYSNLNGMTNGVRYRDNGTISDDTAAENPDRWGTVTVSSTGVSTMDNTDVVMVALDFDNKKLWFGKNGTFYNSGNPATGTNAQASWDGTLPIIFPLAESYHNNEQTYNFGQDSNFAGNKSTGTNAAADGNGFGDFYYAPPSGYLALCSANLPTSSNIDPAETDDDIPTKLCGAVAYSGTQTSGTAITVGFKPDFIWTKIREASDSRMVDSSRGSTKYLISNTTGTEGTSSTGVTSFTSTGYELGADQLYNGVSGGTPYTYVAWCWRANGGTTSTNTDGNIAVTVQANQAAGFSILTYTGGGGTWGSTNQNTLGHGLSAAPEFMIFKERNATDAWTVFHHSVGAGGGTTAAHNNLRLDNADALYTNQSYKSFGGVMPTSTVITVEGNTTNLSTSNHVAYVWHGVEGYSKFGSYEGNNKTDGAFIYTGFRPSIFFVKCIDATENWVTFDTARSTFNPTDDGLYWNDNAAEATGSGNGFKVDVLSNGFKFRTDHDNLNGANTYVYGAWGDIPFKYNVPF